MSAVSPDCRALEDRLSSRDPDAPIVPDGPHVLACRACADLVANMRIQAALFAALQRPAPSPALLARLSTAPLDFAARRETEKVLALLDSDTLRPQPSPELLGRLAFLPTRARAATVDRKKAQPGFLGRFFADWRMRVALAYAATAVLVLVLKIDPLTTARSAASDLTSVGERAVAEARTVASDRLASVAPLKERFDYRVYRAFAASRARVRAYGQLVVDKVFGGTFEVRDARAAEAQRPRGSTTSGNHPDPNSVPSREG